MVKKNTVSSVRAELQGTTLEDKESYPEAVMVRVRDGGTLHEGRGLETEEDGRGGKPFLEVAVVGFDNSLNMGSEK